MALPGNRAWGDTFFFYAPSRDVPADRKFPFATIVTKDYGEFDGASDLNREGVFRLNVGVGKETFAALFWCPRSRRAMTTLSWTRSCLTRSTGKCSGSACLTPTKPPRPFENAQFGPLLAEAYERGCPAKARGHPPASAGRIVGLSNLSLSRSPLHHLRHRRQTVFLIFQKGIMYEPILCIADPSRRRPVSERAREGEGKKRTRRPPRSPSAAAWAASAR